MSVLEEYWSKLCKEPPEQPLSGTVAHLLVGRIRAAANDPSLENRLSALRAARHLGSVGALNAVRPFLSDPERVVRQELARLACDAGDLGYPLIQHFVADPNPDLACEAIARLITEGDASATGRAKGQLRHSSARVRAFALIYLGYVGGSSLARLIAPLENDDVPWVASCATWALAAIDTNTRTGPPIPIDPPRATAKTTPATKAQAKPPPEDDPITALLRQLGSAKIPSDALLSSLLTLPRRDVDAAVRKIHAGDDEVLTLGRLIAAAHLADPRYAPHMRRVVQDTRTVIRVQAAKTLGLVAPASYLPWLAKLLSDTEPGVQVAAAQAVGLVAVRTGDHTWARNALEPLLSSPNPSLQEACHQALAQLEPTPA